MRRSLDQETYRKSETEYLLICIHLNADSGLPSTEAYERTWSRMLLSELFLFLDYLMTISSTTSTVAFRR